jgi:hypothetical protein
MPWDGIVHDIGQHRPEALSFCPRNLLEPNMPWTTFHARPIPLLSKALSAQRALLRLMPRRTAA